MFGVIHIQRLPELARTLACIFNAILLWQLILIASANPSLPLTTAVLFECALFLSINAYRAWRSKSKAALAEESALAGIEQRLRFVYWFRRLMALGAVTLLTLVCLYMSADACALTLCRCGQVSAGARIYEAISLRVPGVDPAFSLELLTGAYIERGQPEKAEPLVLALLHIRKCLFGEEHEMTAAMYSNLGDFYSKCGRASEAEACYRYAIQMIKRIKVEKGWGSPVTKLGTLMRSEGRLFEAEESYLDALNIRTKLFGPKSEKVGETLAAYEVLLRQEGRLSEAADVHNRLDRISRSLAAPKGAFDWLPASMLLVAAWLFVWQRGRLLVFCSKILQKRDHLPAENRSASIR